MIKKILLFLLTVVFSWGADAVTFEYKPLPRVDEQGKTSTSEVLSNKIINASLTDSYLLFNSEKICEDVMKYSYDKNGAFIKYEPITDMGTTTKILIDFNPDKGDFTCLYKNEQLFGEGKIYKLTRTIYGYKPKIQVASKQASPLGSPNFPMIDAFTLFNGKYKPDNYDALQNYQDSDNDFSALREARNMGLLFSSQNQEAGNNEKSFTVSQFITGLLTLNSDVVLGVLPNGDININPEVENQMSILHYNGSSWWDEAVDTGTAVGIKIRNLLNKMTFGIIDSSHATPDAVTNAQANLEYTESNSFTSYFDKKIFGLFYSFMTIAWGNIFSYASLLLMGFITLYTGSIVGSQFMMHKLDDEKKDRPFEFPVKTRLIAIGTTLVLSFVQYPAGTGASIPLENGSTEQIQTQTSIAKNLIAYLANSGAVIADLSASSSIAVYLDYLLNATNSQSKSSIQKITKEMKTTLVKQKIKKSFFKDQCVKAYKNRFEQLGSFQSAKYHEDAQIWSPSTAYQQDYNNNFIGANLSPLLCKKLEKDIVTTSTYLDTLKNGVEANIDNLTNDSSPQTLLTRLYVMTQLSATKSLGWINIATLPISHIFMLNGGVIGITGVKSRFTASPMNESKVSKMVSDEVSSQYDAQNNKQMKELLEDKGSPDNSMIEQAVTSLLSYQVYMMLPAFEETRKSIQKVIEGATDIASTLLGGTQTKLALSALKWVSKFSLDENKKSGFASLFLYIASFVLAVYIYKLMIMSIFAGVVTLMTVLKIVLYFVEAFVHFFVSPLIVAWTLTINPQTDRLHKYIVSGFIIYFIKPTLIVFSCVMFIFSYEIMQSLYSLIFDLAYSSLEFSNEMIDSNDIGSIITMGAVKGFGDVFIMIFGMILAYFMILKGDDLILGKFGYKDDMESGISHQLGDRLQQISGGKI